VTGRCGCGLQSAEETITFTGEGRIFRCSTQLLGKLVKGLSRRHILSSGQLAHRASKHLRECGIRYGFRDNNRLQLTWSLR
jgi:hypothetical protein